MRSNKAINILIATLMALLLALPALAEEPLKLGVIDIQRAMTQSEKGKVTQKKLRTKVAKLDESLKALEDEARTIANEMERQASLLSETLKKKKQERFLEIRAEAQKIEREKKQVADEFSAIILRDLEKILDAIAKEEGYHMILTTDGPWMVYYRPILDITDEVIRRYDEQSK
jgi:outer membrane protein